MVKVNFYPLTLDYIDDSGAGNRGVIRIFGRSKDGKRICVLDNKFSQYFWVIVDGKEKVAKITDKILELKLKEGKRVAYATQVKLEQKKYLAEDVYALKVEVNNPKDVNPLRDNIKNMSGVKDCLETDVPFVRRYLVSRNIIPSVLCSVEGEVVESSYSVEKVISAKKIYQDENESMDSPRILAFDIEVYNKRRYPREEDDPILMVSFYGDKNFKKTLTWKKYQGAKKYVEFVKDEGELLVRFKDVISEFKPDYLVGYFSDGFDLPYIRARADKYKIKLNIGLDGSNVKFTRRKGNQTAKIIGYSHVDIFKFIRRVMSGELNLPAYDLDTVTRHLIGKGKSGAKIEDLYKAWDSGGKKIGEFCDYNLADAEITHDLVVNMLPHLHEFVKLCGLPPSDISRMSYGQLVENYILKNLAEFNEIAPNRPHYDEISERGAESFEGAYVFSPKAGLYDDIVILDFKSLYPTIISAHNICPSTLTDKKQGAHKSPDIEYNGKKKNYHFTYKHDGIFPLILREILVRRNRIKEMLKKKKKDPVLNARQYSLKVLANSIYGYFAFSGARWYCKECAAATTAYGREYISKVINKAEENGFNIIYGDTDSVFISLCDGKTMKDTKRFMRDINEDLPSLMELEMEGFYPRGLFVMKKGEEGGAKKKYALIDEDGKIKIVGFETVRGDWSGIAKEVQKKVLDIILIENDLKKAVNYVRGIINDTNNNKIPINKMVIKKQLTKEVDEYSAIGPHVNVAKKMIKKGEYVGAGSEIRYVVQDLKGSVGEGSVPADEAKKYDPEYYITKQIIPAVERIFYAVGYSKEDLIGLQKQKSLGDY
tara:strand:- start:6456 stop:8930 length:2475 start_codon:yes stop_codon:yes gene_type:complete